MYKLLFDCYRNLKYPYNSFYVFTLFPDNDTEEGVRCVVLGPKFHQLVEIYTSVPGAGLQDSV